MGIPPPPHCLICRPPLPCHRDKALPQLPRETENPRCLWDRDLWEEGRVQRLSGCQEYYDGVQRYSMNNVMDYSTPQTSRMVLRVFMLGKSGHV